MQSASETNQDEVLCDQHPRRNKIKSFAISIRGKPRLSLVHSAFEANQTIKKIKNPKKSKKIKKSKKLEKQN